MDAEKANEVKQLCRADPQAKEQWRAYCDQHAAGTKDPNRLTTEQLDAFLNDFHSGMTWSSGSGAGVITPAAMSGGDKAEEVKNLCRNDSRAKEVWRSWTDQNASGTKDPTRLSPESLDQFLSEFYSGVAATGGGMNGGMNGGFNGGMKRPVVLAAPAAGGAPDAELGQIVKAGQRVSPAWKAAWVQFATEQGGGKYDPTKHTKEFLVSFLEWLGSSATGQASGPSLGPSPRPSGPMGALGGGAFKPSIVAPGQGPAKKPRTAPVVSQDPNVAAMAQQVRDAQKSDPNLKQQWSDFCDANAGGTKDPSRHSVDTLTAFLQMFHAA